MKLLLALLLVCGVSTTVNAQVGLVLIVFECNDGHQDACLKGSGGCTIKRLQGRCQNHGGLKNSNVRTEVLK